jgi:hypothetical protein
MLPAPEPMVPSPVPASIDFVPDPARNFSSADDKTGLSRLWIHARLSEVSEATAASMPRVLPTMKYGKGNAARNKTVKSTAREHARPMRTSTSIAPGPEETWGAPFPTAQ